MSKKITIKIDEVFALALKHHQAGDLSNAGNLYRQILTEYPKHSDALHLLGVIAYQDKNYDIAIDYMEKAIKITPLMFACLNNLGNAYYEKKNLDRAVECYKKALELKPDYAEAHNNLANALCDKGDNVEAENHYKKALEINPDFMGPYNNLGNMALKKGEIAAAIMYYEEALKLQPRDAEVLNNIGKALRYKRSDDEAIKYFEMAIQNKPDYADAYSNLGNVYKDKGDFNSAEKYYSTALKIKPDFAEAYNNLGSIKEDRDEAIRYYMKAIELKPDFIEAYNNLGNSYKDKGMFDEAIGYYKKTLDLKHDYTEAYFSLGLLQLLMKNFEEGWQNFEWRFSLEDLKRRVPLPALSQPRWEGDRLEGKTIYVYAEQGFGDTIQFVRYLSLLHDAGAKVLFKPQSELQELFTQNDLKATIINSNASPDLFNFDVHIPLLSLPLLFKTDLSNIPGGSKYLNADKNKVASFHGKYFDNSKFKIGICWQGRLTHPNDRNRSLPLGSFYRFARMQDVQLYSLQKGKGTEQLDSLPEGIEIVDLSESLNDFSDTAAAIENLDLVITVDTSVAHLSGALGKPTWILLPFIPDWRWFMDAEDSPWYESVRLSRQKEIGRWDDALEKVSISLQCLL